ncbi:hypothetical protein PT974_11996 [Cladobotryum mycophilum]|uniref:Arf-GAP domain-containing protein n=1 Tax=Cladobotryum mycophilum TaxID=491253 RepID=A0ABR0S890_9HYPO
MSRRAPNPAAERAAQNQATIKSLLKLEANKVCADCKRNKHPRWASWNLGIFVCIRCSGIHRGMGTHISRVKSVDLDSWTDEQLQSVLNWGNARANKYWEAKLASGHAPSEAKIENFIRTKYELKRWVMDGPIPDPSTLDCDDEVPLSIVKEKQVVNRNETIRKSSVGQSQAPKAIAAPVADLISSIDPIPQQRTGPPASNVTPKAEPAPPKSTGTKDSLLGLDFFGTPSAPPRPASTTGVSSGGQSRPDLKQSILSLYASAPKPQPPPQQQHQQQASFGGMGHQQQGSLGGFNDAFSNLSMGTTTSPKPAAADPFASLGSATRTQPSNAFGGLSGGSFFDSKPAHQSRPSNSGFGAFATPAPAPAPAPVKASSAMDDLFDFSATTTTASPPPVQQKPPAQPSSVFNLSAPQSKPAVPVTAASTATALGGASLSGADVWGASEWSSAPPAAPLKSPKLPKPAASGAGWGNTGGGFASTPIIPGSGGGFNPAPKVAADEEFGGWASSTGPATSGVAAPSAKGFGEGSEDLFNNVWQ